MATQMLWMHWRTVRLGLLPLALAAFGLPLLVVQQMGTWASPGQQESAALVLEVGQDFLLAFPMLAAAVGFTLALTAWSWDHRMGHIYALSLPVSRARYAVLKFGAGAVLALVPVTCLLAGSMVATATIALPAGLRAYPLELSARFLFAVLLLYSLLFAMAAGTIRTTVIVLSAAVAIPFFWSLGFELLGPAHPLVQQLPGWEQVYEGALVGFGPFRILAGNWMLFDA
jgi:hypothetical protein